MRTFVPAQALRGDNEKNVALPLDHKKVRAWCLCLLLTKTTGQNAVAKTDDVLWTEFEQDFRRVTLVPESVLSVGSPTLFQSSKGPPQLLRWTLSSCLPLFLWAALMKMSGVIPAVHRFTRPCTPLVSAAGIFRRGLPTARRPVGHLGKL
jgi:hypothetical protein